MSLKEKIAQMNAKYRTEEQAKAAASESRRNALYIQQQRIAALRDNGPAFVHAVYEEVSRVANEASAQIENPAQKLTVVSANESRQVILTSGGRLMPKQLRYPCAYVLLGDDQATLMRGLALGPNSARDEPIEWRAVDGKIELRKDGEALSVKDFAEQLVSDYLDLIAPSAE